MGLATGGRGVYDPLYVTSTAALIDHAYTFQEVVCGALHAVRIGPVGNGFAEGSCAERLNQFDEKTATPGDVTGGDSTEGTMTENATQYACGGLPRNGFDAPRTDRL